MKSSRYYHGNKKLKKRKPEYHIENNNKKRKIVNFIKIDNFDKNEIKILLDRIKILINNKQYTSSKEEELINIDEEYNTLKNITIENYIIQKANLDKIYEKLILKIKDNDIIDDVVTDYFHCVNNVF